MQGQHHVAAVTASRTNAVSICTAVTTSGYRREEVPACPGAPGRRCPSPLRPRPRMRTQSATIVPAVPRQVKKDDECVVLGDSAEKCPWELSIYLIATRYLLDLQTQDLTLQTSSRVRRREETPPYLLELILIFTHIYLVDSAPPPPPPADQLPRPPARPRRPSRRCQ